MKKSLILLIISLLSLGSTCNQKVANETPDFVTKSILKGEITSGTGVFSDLPNYKFTTEFKSASQFITKNIENKLESQGNYTYNKFSNNSAKIILSTEDQTQELQIILKFTSRNEGVYEAYLLKGGLGTQTGVFELKGK
ncbi:MAG: hypothetical protein O2897_01210 [bacterium]|nr:hypothetical protein [bacterium]